MFLFSLLLAGRNLIKKFQANFKMWTIYRLNFYEVQNFHRGKYTRRTDGCDKISANTLKFAKIREVKMKRKADGKKLRDKTLHTFPTFL